MHKLVRILKKEAGHVGQKPCADSVWYGTNGAASVSDVMQWIPTVYKYPSPVETYTVCFWRMFRPQNGPTWVLHHLWEVLMWFNSEAVVRVSGAAETVDYFG